MTYLLRFGTLALGLTLAAVILFTAIVLESLTVGALAIVTAAAVIIETGD